MAGGGGATASGGAAPQAIGGSNKGGGAQGAQSTATAQDLLQQMQRQRTYDQIGGGLQKAGSQIGQPQPYMQGAAPGYPGGGAAPGYPGGGAAPGYPGGGAAPGYLDATGPLFQGMGGGGGGINEQQLAAILRQLGYGG